MKLKLVERTKIRLYSGEPKLSIQPSGNIYVNKKAMELFNIEKPTFVKFFQDQDDQQAWFLNLCEDGYSRLSFKSTKDGTGSMYIKDISVTICNSFYHVGNNALRFKVLPAIQFDGYDFYPLQVIKESIEMEIPNPNGK